MRVFHLLRRSICTDAISKRSKGIDRCIDNCKVNGFIEFSKFSQIILDSSLISKAADGGFVSQHPSSGWKT